MIKPLLYSTAMAAALAIAGPGWAQSTMTPSGTPTGTPATPYSQTAPAATPNTSYTQQPTAAQAGSYTQPQAGTYAQPQGAYSQQPTGAYPQQPTTAQTMPAPATGAISGTTGEQATEAMPTRRHHMASRHHRRGHVAARRSGQMNDNIAEQLNREEANRVASGTSMAPAGSAPAPAAAGQPQSAPMTGTQMR